MTVKEYFLVVRLLLLKGNFSFSCFAGSIGMTVTNSEHNALMFFGLICIPLELYNVEQIKTCWGNSCGNSADINFYVY